MWPLLRFLLQLECPVESAFDTREIVHQPIFNEHSLAYTSAMRRRRYRFRPFLGLTTAVLVGSCTLATAALGQATPTDLPADCSGYASIPLPAEAAKVPVPKAPPDCASYRSYRGIGRPVNYSEARACAWQERLAQKAGLGQNQNEPTAWVVGGSLILADIYFNGEGVKRNIPLAMRFACESEEAMAKQVLEGITDLSDSPRTNGPFEFCDYAETTFTMDFCVDYASEIEDDRRSRYYSSLKSSMPPEQQAAFEKLLTAEDAYIEAHASEVDQGGTIRAIRTVGSEKILNNLFHTEIVRFERKEWPALSGNRIETADGLLSREYQMKLQQLQSQTKQEIDEGAVTADHLSNVEETWQTYRDAWVTFARLRYPGDVAAIRAEITLERYRWLKSISAYSE